MTRIILLAALALGACTGYPDLGRGTATARDDYPQLVPLTALLASAQTEQLTDPTLSRDLAARAQRLRTRAAAMRRSAVSDADIARMRAAIARNSG